MSNQFLEFNQQSELTGCMKEIIDLFIDSNIEIKNFNSILSRYSIKDIQDLKFQAIDYLIQYATFILEDNFISENEMTDFSLLKSLFKIKTGDFLKFKKFEISEIIKKQFIRIYSDDFVDKSEMLENVNLQALFDLGYDEFEEFKQDEVIRALINGADPHNLDISKLPKGFNL